MVLSGAGCVDRNAQAQAKRTEQIITDPVVVVTATTAQTRTIAETLEITGSVTTADDTQVSAKGAGKLVSVTVRDGDPVRPGQVIAQLETTQLQTQLRQALAQVAQARAGLSQAISNAAINPSRSAAGVRQAQAQLAAARQQLKSAEAQYARVRNGARPEERRQAEANVAAAKQNLDTAQKNLNRVSRLVAEGALAASALDNAQNQYQSAASQYENALQALNIVQTGARSEDLLVAQAAVGQAREAVRQAQEGVRVAEAQQRLDVTFNDQVAAAQAQVSAAQAQVQSIQTSIADATIRAPFGGRISGKPLQPGTVVSPGVPIARIVGGEGAYFEGQVPEVSVARITVGQQVQVTVDALPGQRYTGTVVAVSPQGESVGRLFRVRISLLGATESLKPGMFARGNVQLRVVPNAVVVPATAIVRRSNQDLVFIAQGETAKRVNVRRGLQQGDLVQIDGVNPGDRVIVQGQSALEDGSKIREEKPTAANSASGA